MESKDLWDAFTVEFPRGARITWDTHKDHPTVRPTVDT